MNSTASLKNEFSTMELKYKEEFRAKASEYFKKQHLIVIGLHRVLQGISYLIIILATVFFFVAMYYTVLWTMTGSLTSLGEATNLPIAWATFGLSMSFVVFPWGLDSMLTRVFPAVIFPISSYRSSKPIQFKTGIGAFFAGLGIMFAGAPGAVYIIGMGLDIFRSLF